MPERDNNLPPDFLARPPKMGDQNKLPPWPQAWVSTCAFCGTDLAHYESAGLVIEYAGQKFCGVPCLESWIDGTKP